MRWKQPEKYDFRYKLRFAFLPKKLNGETRWLEPYFVFQSYWIGWEDHIFADWHFRDETEGTWLFQKDNSLWHSYSATCSLCGHEKIMTIRTYEKIIFPKVCPKCGWEKEESIREDEDE